MEQTAVEPAVLSLPARQHAAAARARTAIAVLAFCCLCWGYSFPTMKYAIHVFEAEVARISALPQNEELPVMTRFAVYATFNGWRFLAAAALYWLLTRKQQRGWSSHEVRGGIWLGVLFACGMLPQIIGLRYTLPSVSSFLTALVVVFAPLGQAVVFKRRVGWQTWMAVAVAMVGIAILSQPDPECLACAVPTPKAPFPFMGEALTILGAMFFTAHIMALDFFGKNANIARLTLMMFLATGVCSMVAGLALGGGAIYKAALFPALFGHLLFSGAMFTLTVFSSVLALHLMNTYQPRISPATASVVYCLEPVCATLFSLAVGTEQAKLAIFVGGATIIAAVLMVALRKEPACEPASQVA
ncbi:MAG TPA: DMT family transporter [Planctomycetota bacterium]|jgi:drug/metabolite transporter (DMT)-like permease